MGFLFDKKKRGRLYTYWGESARVDGRPRLVEQVYLGPKERVLEEIRQAYTRGQSPGPSPLRQLDHLEFGASSLLWREVEQLDLPGLVDQQVPAAPPQRRTQLSVGQYLALAAVNRALEACSKRCFYRDWYRHSVIRRLCPARESELSSQRFWDHMDQVDSAHIEAIQQNLLQRLHQLFPLGQETILYDTTNFFTFIDTFNSRSQLAERGHNKQKRSDLRQLNLALFEDQQTGLPLYHQCYEGNQPDVSRFNANWQAWLQNWLRGFGSRPQQLTLVFDKGNTSKQNLQELEAADLHHVGSVPGHWIQDLLEVPLGNFEKLSLAGTKHLKVHRLKRPLWELERTFVVVFSPSLYRKQVAAMNRYQQKVESQLTQLAQVVERGRTQVTTVEKKITQWSGRDHLRDFLETQIETQGEQAQRLTWVWNRTRKRATQRKYFGKTVLFTDRHDWSTEQIVSAYRRLARTERLFQLSKGRSGPWWPMYHWTDSKIRVHALYCHFALLLLTIVQARLRQAGLNVRADRALHQLKKIQETRVLYSNGASERVLSHLDEDQRQLAVALHLPDLARKMGTTLLQEL